MEFITDLSQVPVGPKIAEMVDKFDSDPAVRATLLGNLHADSMFEPLTPEEVEDAWPDAKLIHMPSAVWARESAMATLGHVLTVRDQMIRGHGDLLTTSFAPEAIPFIESLRAEWLANPKVHQPVDALVAVLEKSARGFNIQMVAGWVQRIPSTLLENMELCAGQEYRSLLWDLNMVADRGYFDGRHVLQVDVGQRAIPALDAVLPDSSLLYDLLHLSAETIAQLRNERMGLPSDQQEGMDDAKANGGEHRSSAEIVDVIEIETPGYAPTSSGLLLPERPVQKP